MINKKRVVVSVLCLLLLVFGVFSFTACKNEVENFNLSFKVNGDTYQTITTSGDETISIPENPSKEGYTFDGWYWDKDVWSKPFTANSLMDAPISSDMSVYAKFSAIEYDITYENDGGTHNNPVSYTIENGFTLSAAEKLGYTFVGWYSDNAYATKVESVSVGSTGAISLYAKFEIENYTISYENTKDVQNTNATGYNVNTDTIILSDLSKTGYTFEGWYNGEQKVTEIAKGSTGDLTLTARWSIDGYSITYHNTEGSTNTNPNGYDVEDLPLTLSNASKDYYNFVGWYTEATFENKVTEIAVGTTGNINLYAKWEAVEYTATFKDGNTVVDEIKFTVETDSITAPAVPTHTGYTGVWESYTLGTENITVNAVYTAIEYTATFKDGETTVGTVKFTVETDYITAPAVPTHTGYTGVWESYTLGTENITINAVYTAVEYTATFKDGETIVGTVKFTVETDSITAPAVPTHTGYTGVWESYTLGAEDIVINAIYSKVDYTISYHNVTGATNTNPAGYNVETLPIELNDATKRGYTFLGWYTEPTFENKVSEITDGTTGNINLYAKWEIIEYTATFKDGNTVVDKITFTVETDSITAPSVPTHIGYTGAWESYSLGTESITVNAIYTTIEYTATFKDGNTVVGTIKFTVETDSITAPAVPDHVGYTGVWESYSLGAQNITIDAVYTAIEYTATFKDGDTIVDEIIFTVETESINEPNVPAHTGYTGKWEEYTLGTQNITIDAIYELVPYGIIYHNTTGATHSNPTGYDVEDQPIILKDASKTGYKFIGWYAEETFENKVTEIAVGTTGNINLYAKWEAVEYTATFKDGNTVVDEIKFTVETDSINAPAVPTHTGYTGVWESYTLGTGNITVNAVYTAIEYTATFKDGETIVGTVKFTVETDSIIEPAVPTHVGYMGVWENYVLEAEDITISAKYTMVDYCITYMADDVVIATCTYTVENTSQLIEPNVPTKEHYMGKWESYVINYENITVNAVYTPITYSVWFCYGTTADQKIETRYYTIEDSSIDEPPCGTSFGYYCTWSDYVLDGGNKTVNVVYNHQAKYEWNSTEQAFDVVGYNYLIDGRLEILSTISDKPVLTITENSLSNISGMTAVMIEDGIEQIESYAFYYCRNLQSVSIPNSVMCIGEYAFAVCDNLESISIPVSVTEIGIGAFGGCAALEEIAIPFVGATVSGDSSTNFGWIFGTSDYEKHDDFIPTTLKRVNVLGGTRIGDCAFYNCANIEEIQIPTSTAYVGTEAFALCSSLTGLHIPNSVIEIGCGALKACNSIKTLVIPFVGDTSSSGLHFGHIFGKTSYSDSSASIPNSLLYVTVTGGVDYYLPQNAFRDCDAIEEITITTAYIRDYTFYGCEDLKNVNITLNENLVAAETIGAYAFYGCGLTSFNMPDCIKNVGDYAFYGCSKLQTIGYSSSLETIGKGAFAACRGLSELALPEGLITISSAAFQGVYAKIVVIPNSVTTIERSAFGGCILLEELTMPQVYGGCLGYIFGATYYQENQTYVPSSLKNVTITNANTVMDDAFFCCSFIWRVYLNDGLASIGRRAFYQCTNLVCVEIPDTVSTIGEQAFYGCVGLTEVELPSAIEALNGSTFQNCTSLTHITIPKNLKNIGGSDFYGCEKMSELCFEDGSMLESIGESAFTSCDLKMITLPASVVTIGWRAFASNVNLQAVTFSKNSCLQTVCEEAFCWTALTTVEIPETLTTIGTAAFGINIDTIHIASLSAWLKITMDSPISSKQGDWYLNGCLLEEVEIPEDITEINDYAFYFCTSLKSVVIHDEVTSIGDKAFFYCFDLDTVSITKDSKLKTIGEDAFCNTSLLSILIPAGVSSIGDGAFSGCSSLVEVYNLSDLEISKGFSTYGCVGQYAIDIHTAWFTPSNMEKTEDGFVYYNCADGKYLVKYLGAEEEVTISSDVVGIWKYTFSGCSNITDIIFEEPNGWQLQAGEYDSTNTVKNAEILTGSGCCYTWVKSESTTQ